LAIAFRRRYKTTIDAPSAPTWRITLPSAILFPIAAKRRHAFFNRGAPAPAGGSPLRLYPTTRP
jgi:hypothetical protein